MSSGQFPGDERHVQISSGQLVDERHVQMTSGIKTMSFGQELGWVMCWNGAVDRMKVFGGRQW